MHIALLCATERGYRFLRKLANLQPDAKLSVFSFREDPWEPPFIDNIRRFAEKQGYDFIETKNVGHSRWHALWDTSDIDLMFVVSWRYMIPAVVYEKPRLGTYVFHDSLLPAYRGFSPTVWAMINGEKQTGVTMFRISADVDAGDILAQSIIPIEIADTIATVMEKVTDIYLQLLEENIDLLLAGNAKLLAQDHSQATYTCKLLPEDFQIDWSLSSQRIYDLIRSVSVPYPGAFTTLLGKKLRIWSSQLVPDSLQYVGRIPGRVVEIIDGIGTIVLTGDGTLLIQDVQLDDSEILPASAIVNRYSHTLGS